MNHKEKPWKGEGFCANTYMTYIGNWPRGMETCNRSVKRDGMCGIHARQVEEASRKNREYQANNLVSSEGRERATTVIDVLKELGIESKINYISRWSGPISGRYDGEFVLVKIDDLLPALGLAPRKP